MKLSRSIRRHYSFSIFNLLLALLILIPGQAFSSEEKWWSGFVDARYRSGAKNGLPQGFVIYDGAFYLDKKFEDTDLFLDIPFSYEPDNYSTATTFNNLKIMRDKPQAFIKYRGPFGLSLTLGQFDSLFGVEANDSAERMFADFSLVSWNMLPTTHTGLVLAYEPTENLAFNFLVANGNGHGFDMTNKKKQIGGVVSYGHSLGELNINSSLGMRSDRSGTNLIEEKKDKFYQLTLGLEYRQLSLGLEGYRGDYDSMADKATGFAANLGAKFLEIIETAIRYSQLKKFQGTIFKAQDWGLAVKVSLTQQLDFRWDYSRFETQAIQGGAKLKDRLTTVGLLHSF